MPPVVVTTTHARLRFETGAVDGGKPRRHIEDAKKRDLDEMEAMLLPNLDFARGAGDGDADTRRSRCLFSKYWREEEVFPFQMSEARFDEARPQQLRRAC